MGAIVVAAWCAFKRTVVTAGSFREGLISRCVHSIAQDWMSCHHIEWMIAVDERSG